MLARLLIPLTASLWLAACASSPDDDTAAAKDDTCRACGEIVDIDRVRGSEPRADAPARAARIMPEVGRGGDLTDRLGLQYPVGTAGTFDAPVYQVHGYGKIVRRAEVTLRMDDGFVRSLLVEGAECLRVGDRVKIVGLQLVPIGPEAPPAPDS